MDTASDGPAVFVSYAHRDRVAARRLRRWLAVHRIPAWLDEQQLRVGTKLGEGLRRHLEACDVVVVVATAASASSPWVGLELDAAAELGRPVVPWFVEPVATDPRFRDHLGVEVTAPDDVGASLVRLVEALGAAWDRPGGSVDPSACEAGLRALVEEVPATAGLVLGCLDGPGMLGGTEEGVAEAGFDAVDEAVELLMVWECSARIASHAAWALQRLGAGRRAMERWVAGSGDGGTVLAVLAGSPSLPPERDDVVLSLLRQASPPNDQALSSFVARHAGRLSPARREEVLRLVAWPVRRTPDGFAGDVAWEAWRAFPDAPEVRQLWRRWIQDGTATPRLVARTLADAAEERLAGREELHEVLRTRVRALLRSGTRAGVVEACDHLRECAEADTPVLAELLREADGVDGTAEWASWADRGDAEADEASWCAWYVHGTCNEARGDHDWLGAFREADRMAALDRERRHRR